MLRAFFHIFQGWQKCKHFKFFNYFSWVSSYYIFNIFVSLYHHFNIILYFHILLIKIYFWENSATVFFPRCFEFQWLIFNEIFSCFFKMDSMKVKRFDTKECFILTLDQLRKSKISVKTKLPVVFERSICRSREKFHVVQVIFFNIIFTLMENSSFVFCFLSVHFSVFIYRFFH